MRVTELEEVSKSRVRVYIDAEPAFVIYKGERGKYGIERDCDLTEEIYQEIVACLLPKRARLRCMNLLKNRDYTERQLRDKLGADGYPPSCIEDAIAYVKSYHYVDDGNYAEHYIEESIAKKSKRQIEYSLHTKGVDREVIAEAFERLEEMGVEQDETALITKLLEKKRFDPENADLREKRRMYGFLNRKGFSSEVIAKVLQIY